MACGEALRVFREQRTLRSAVFSVAAFLAVGHRLAAPSVHRARLEHIRSDFLLHRCPSSRASRSVVWAVARHRIVLPSALREVANGVSLGGVILRSGSASWAKREQTVAECILRSVCVYKEGSCNPHWIGLGKPVSSSRWQHTGFCLRIGRGHFKGRQGLWILPRTKAVPVSARLPSILDPTELYSSKTE